MLVSAVRVSLRVRYRSDEITMYIDTYTNVCLCLRLQVYKFLFSPFFLKSVIVLVYVTW